MGLSFAQLRKLRECVEYKYALAATHALEHFNLDPFDPSNEVARDYGHIQGALNGVKFKRRCEDEVEKTSKMIRWADKVQKAAMKRQRGDSGIETDEARRTLIFNLARECW